MRAPKQSYRLGWRCGRRRPSRGCCCHSRRCTGTDRRSGRGTRRRGPADPSETATVTDRAVLPLTRPAACMRGRHHPGHPVDPTSTARGGSSGCMCSPAGCGSSSASRAWCPPVTPSSPLRHSHPAVPLRQQRSHRSAPTGRPTARHAHRPETRGGHRRRCGRLHRRDRGLLHMSEATVKAHVSRLLSKLNVTNRVQIAILVRDATNA